MILIASSKQKNILLGALGIALFFAIGIAIPKLTVHDMIPAEADRSCVEQVLNKPIKKLSWEWIVRATGQTQVVSANPTHGDVKFYTLFRIPLDLNISINCLLTAEATSTPVVIDKTPVDPTLLSRLQTDLQGITPYFIDSRSYDGKPLTSQEDKIKNDVIDILVAKEPDNREYYSQLWPLAIGKRDVLVMQPSASSYYHILIDSQTGESSIIRNAASYIIHPLPFERREPTVGKQTVLYIGYQDMHTYTLDEGTFILVPGSKLSGSETYHNGRGDFNLLPEETHDDDSIHISVFDSSQVIQNPNALPNTLQTMNKKLREVDLTF